MSEFLRVETNHPIAVVLNKSQHFHVQRLLLKYLPKFNLNFIDIKDYLNNKALTNGAYLVICALDERS